MTPSKVSCTGVSCFGVTATPLLPHHSFGVTVARVSLASCATHQNTFQDLPHLSSYISQQRQVYPPAPVLGTSGEASRLRMRNG